MPFKDTITVEEHGQLSEQDRVLYIKTPGQNGAADAYDLHPSFKAERTALSTNSQALKAEKDRLAASLKPFTDLGLDEKKAKELLDAHNAAEAAKLTDKERKERDEQARKEAHQREIEGVKTEAKKREDFLMKELKRFAVDMVADSAIARAGVREGADIALRPLVKQAIEMIEEGDGDDKKVVTRIIGADKAPRYVGTALMTADQLVEELKKQPGLDGLFKPTGVGGSGTQRQRQVSTFQNTDSLSATQMIEKGLQARMR